MTDADIKIALDDSTALFLTMFGEGRGDALEGGSSVEERIAVGCVLRNRVSKANRFGGTYRAVALARGQFSCWWTWGGKENYAVVMSIARSMVERVPMPGLNFLERSLLLESMFLAEGIIGGQIIDRVKGSTHYYAPAAMVPKNAVPEWARGQQPRAVVGQQLFFVAA